MKRKTVMGAKLIKTVVFLSSIVNALVLELNTDEFDVNERNWTNPLDGGLGKLTKEENKTDMMKTLEEMDKVLKNNDALNKKLSQLLDENLKISQNKDFVNEVGTLISRMEEVILENRKFAETVESLKKELLPHSAYGFSWGDTFYDLMWISVGGLCMTLTIYWINSSWDMFARRRNIVIVIFCCFLLSIPWEWFRMYKSALSKKTANSLKDIPPECFLNEMTALNSIRLWLKDHFSTESDQCAVYHEAIIVDPIWEVSPLMATSACLTRLYVEPFKQLAAISEEYFKLIFKEIPVQWQHIAFITVVILLIVSIISFSGFEIKTPLLRISTKYADDLKIATYTEKISSLKATNKLLQANTPTYTEKISYLEATIKLLQAKTETYTKKISSLEDANESLQANTATDKEKISSLEATIESLQAKLDGLEKHRASISLIRNDTLNENSVNYEADNEPIEPIFVDNDNRESRACETE